MAEHWNGGTGGKGDRPRPFNISDEEYEANLKRIFGDKTAEKERKEKEKAEFFERLNAETRLRMSPEYDDKPTRYNEETQEVLKYNK